MDNFYNHLQEVADQTTKKDVAFVLGNRNAKVGTDTYKDWRLVQMTHCNPESNETGQVTHCNPETNQTTGEKHCDLESNEAGLGLL